MYGKSAGIKMTWFGNILYGLCDSKNMITRKLVKLYDYMLIFQP